jgi:hypothetical protein
MCEVETAQHKERKNSCWRAQNYWAYFVEEHGVRIMTQLNKTFCFLFTGQDCLFLIILCNNLFKLKYGVHINAKEDCCKRRSTESVFQIQGSISTEWEMDLQKYFAKNDVIPGRVPIGDRE